jgi:hypothetical protein
MDALNSADEARLLQDLLAESHSRIRELESRVDRLANELLTLMLNDRRRHDGSHSNVKRERRRSVRAVESQRERIKPSLLT